MSLLERGGMAERFKAAVLKTADREVRGFESLSLRQFCAHAQLGPEGVSLLSTPVEDKPCRP